MNLVQIVISRQNAYDDILVKSHIDAAVIVDATERYMVEAGSEKAEQIHQCISDAFGEALILLRRFLEQNSITTGGTSSYDGEGDLELTFDISDRRAHYFAETLTPAVHAFVVDAALGKYYATIRPVFAEPYLRRLADDTANIRTIIFTKQPPEIA